MNSQRHRLPIIIGGGHNGLVYILSGARGIEGHHCAGAAQCRGRRGRHGRIPSRIPQFDGELHGFAPQSQDHRGYGSRGTRSQDRRPQGAEFPARRRQTLSRDGRRAHQNGSEAKFSARDAERLDEYNARLAVLADLVRSILLETPPNATDKGWGAAVLEMLGAVGGRHRAWHARHDGAARSPGAVRAIGGRHAGRLVRKRSHQGCTRLRRHRRQLHEPLFAGHGLCAASSLLRRDQRPERRVGSCHRRHGRDHAGDGTRLRRQGRRHPYGKRRSRIDRGKGEGRRRRHGKRRDVSRARHRLQSQSEIAVLEARRCEPFAGGFPRAYERLSLRLGHVPHECGAVGIAAVYLPAGARRSSDRRHHHGAEPSLLRTGLSRREGFRLVARAHRRDAHSFDAR